MSDQSLNRMKVKSLEYILSKVTGGSAAWGSITGTLSSQTDLQTALNAKMAKSSNLSDLTNFTTARLNLLPSATGNSLKFLRVNAGETDYELATLAGGGDLLSTNNLSDLTNFATARTNLGATTVGSNLFTVANPSAVRFIRIDAANTVTLRSASNFLSDIGGQPAGSYLTSETDPVFAAWLASPLVPFIDGTSGERISFSSNIIAQPSSGKFLQIQDFLSGKLAQFDTSAISSDHTYTFPDQDGTFAMTVDLSSFITSESDPIFLASAAAGITGGNITNWNSAFSWGNHALAGYLTSITSLQVTTALGFTPVTNARTLTINGSAQSLSADRTWTISTVTGNAGTATALLNARTIGGVSFDGTANIVPQTIQSVNEATDTTCFPLFISAAGSQSLQPLNNAGFIYNSNTNALTATTFIGALTGTASGNLVSGGALGTPSSGTLTSCTGLPVSTGISGLGSGVATFLATATLANFDTAIGITGTPSASTFWRGDNSWSVPASVLADSDYGDVVVSGTGTVFTVESVAGVFAFKGVITPPQIVATTADYNPTGLSGAYKIRLDTDATRILTGLQGGVDGRRILLQYIGSFTLVISHDAAGSTAANRFYNSNGGANSLIANTSIEYQYDGTLSRWVQVSLGGSSNNVVITGAYPVLSIAASAVTNTMLAGSITSAKITSLDESKINFTNIATGNVSTSAHGFCPIAPNDTSQVLLGDGTFGVQTKYGTTASTSTSYTFTSADYGKILLWSPSGTATATLPANGAAAGVIIDVLLLTNQTITISAATADTLITLNDTAADSIAFSTTSTKIGAWVRFVSNGSFWIAVNLSNHTMTIAT